MNKQTLEAYVYDTKEGEYKDVAFTDVEGYEFIDEFFIIIKTNGDRHCIKSTNLEYFSLTAE